MEPDRLLQRLIESRVEFVLVGGLAAIVHKVPITTDDTDICLHFTRDNLDRLASAVSDLHAKHRLTANRLAFEITDANWSMFKNIYLQLDWGVLDCLGEVLGVGNYADVLENSNTIDLPFGPCRVLSVEALIRAKEAVGRDHDMRTVGYLRAIYGKQREG